MKKVLSVLLVVIMILTMAPITVFSAEKTSVKLVSFMRGDVDDLRSSELLEVQVEGYDGNPRELTYKWTSSLGTYLYVYNSHNMYGINNTDGEREIYNSAKKINKKDMTGSTSMAGRTYDKTFKEVGFAWASVYGADISGNQLDGTVTVEVFDKSGNSLGKGSYTNFEDHNLDKDIDNVVIGLFEGDRMDVRDLLGQSGVVHITCSASKVSSATILDGGEYIEVEKVEVDRNTNEYYVKGIKAGTNETGGDAQLSISIKKEYCKFHAYTSGTAQPIVYVFKKPKTETTTTTLTLVKDIDSRCEYFINGNKGEEQPDGTILFTGLDPNTTYTVEVRAEYDDKGTTKYVYGYVEDTTKPVYLATVKTYLDGELKDVSAIHGAEVELLLRNGKSGTEYISLTKNGTGTYEATVVNGTYIPYHSENGTYHEARGYELIIENANAELHLHHYTVRYDTNGGAFKAGEEVGTEVFSSMTAVNATSNVPVREGFIFAGWEYDGRVIGSGKQITSSISSPLTLKAKWERAVNVTINVIIDHKTADGYDSNSTRAELDVDFLEMKSDSPAFIETGDKLHFSADMVIDEAGSEKAYSYNLEDNVSTYTATDYTYTGLLESSTFGVAVSKSGYDVGEISKKQDKLGNWTILIPLTYNPDDFDLDFSVEMDDDVPKELYPDAVIVKIACWNAETNEWKIISQHETVGAVVKPGVRVDIDPVTGEGSGSYPVWKFDGEGEAYGYRAVVTGFIYDNSTIIVPTEKDHTKDDNTVIVTYTDGNYTAIMSDIDDGKKFSTSLNGAYYNQTTDAQQGTLHGVITVEKYDVIFDANGGEINGGDTFTKKDEYYVPDVNNYVPTFGEHTFKGWYKDPDFKEPAVSGELLTETITLYAKWDQILTGNVRVAGSYLQDGTIVDVWSVDRANSAAIVLQEITADGVYNIDIQTVNIVWPMSNTVYGISEEYRFTGLDPMKTYRIEVLLLNYGTTYQNSTTVFNGDDNDYAGDYNETDFKAVYPEDSKWSTFVNAYLSFEPASYFQPVEVDATLVGESLRPKDTLVEIIYKATGSDNAFQIISQHTVDPFGIKVGMGTDGMDNGDYGYSVWNSVYDGTLYDYQAHLTKIDGVNATEWPVSVVYGAPSRYSPIHDAPTGVLQVKLIPNRYDIFYHEYYADEETEVVSHGTHIWSYETNIDYIPDREGYVFAGWYTNPECTGEVVTVIDKTVAEDTYLYAKWEKRTDLELEVNYVDIDTNEVLAEETKTSQIFGDVITAESLRKDFTGYSFDSASAESVTIGSGTNEITLYYAKNSYEYTVNYLEEDTDNVLSASKTVSAVYGAEVTEKAIVIDGYTLTSESIKTITIDTENNVINFYYAADTFGGGEDGDESDEIPDKYQKKVIFKVVNGTWANGSSADIIKVVNLTKDGEYAVDGTATLEAPVGMLANEGYKNGTWDKEIPATVSGTETLTFTHTFYRATTPVVPTYVKYIVEHYKENAQGTYTLIVADTEIKSGIIGEQVKGEEHKADYDNYVYNEGMSTSVATLKAITTDDDIVVLKLYYDIDFIGDEGGSDGVGDKYQKTVIFKVVNGLWADKTDEKVVIVSLKTDGKDDINGSAELVVPTGMKPNEGFATTGVWDTTPPEIVSGTETVTYTYTFYRATTPVVPTFVNYIVEHYKADEKGNYPEIPSESDMFSGKIGDAVTATAKSYEGYKFNEEVSVTVGTLKAISSPDDILVLRLYYDVDAQGGGEDTPDTPDTPDNPDNPDTPDVPVDPDAPEGDGNGSIGGSSTGYIVFGKTDGIGWYNVSKDGGQTYDIVFGNSTYEVEPGTELIIKAGDILGDSFTFYVNGDAVKPDDKGEIRVTVNGYMLIGAIGIDPDIDFEVPDVEESLNWFQKLIKAIREFFEKIFGWMK